MKIKLISSLSDEELKIEAKKIRSNRIVDAFFIGLFVGILLYSISVGNFSSILTFVLVYSIYKLLKRSNFNKSEVEQQLKKRNLK